MNFWKNFDINKNLNFSFDELKTFIVHYQFFNNIHVDASKRRDKIHHHSGGMAGFSPK